MALLLKTHLIRAAFLLVVTAVASSADRGSVDTKEISRAAADSCNVKIKRLEGFAGNPSQKKKQTTLFSENEINSYLALDLSQKYHPSLKSFTVALEDSKLQGVATIDFDLLAMSSKKFMTKLLSKMFSGVHTLTVRGKLVTNAGKANFQLEEAHFDKSVLPNFLVEEIISAVGRKQKPPFDPMQPSQMPFAIQKVDLHAGRTLIHQ